MITQYEYQVTCFCGSPMALRTSRNGKPFYGCTKFPDCDGAVGAHPDGKPLGIPADGETRRMRRLVHATMQGIWDQEDREQRNQAYEFLLKKCPKPHVSQMNITECWITLRRLGITKGQR